MDERKPTILHQVLEYYRLGWHVIPGPRGKKAPTMPGWQNLRLASDDLPKYFSNSTNVGVLNGEPSSNLVDIDLDSPEARHLANHFLPQTDRVSGRDGSPRSHFWYAANPLVKTRQFENPVSRTESPGKAMIVELRANGTQTIVPPSVHPCGESYRWFEEGQIAVVDGMALQTAVGKLAACALVAHYWAHGKRHDLALAIAGMLLRSAWEPKDAEHFIVSAAQAAGDNELADRRRAVRTTLEKLEAGHAASGIPTLKHMLPNYVLDQIVRWLDLTTIDDQLFKERHPNVRFALTDAGNAEYFAWMFGNRMLFDHRRGRWLRWDRHRWKLDCDGEAARLALDTVRARLRGSADIADDDSRRASASWALKSESRTRLDSLLSLARTLRPIASGGDCWDRDPWLLATPTGVIDLRSSTIRAGSPEDHISMMTNVDCDFGEPTRWLQFLGEIFDGNEALVDFIHRACGYSASGITSEQCLFMAHGLGANGKGTFLNTLRRVLGDYGLNMPFSTVELHQRSAIPNDLALLVNRRFVMASETNDGTRLNEARVKTLTGGDPITARFLHGEFFEFVPVAKFWLAVNHRPIVRDDSHAFWRRLRLIPFSKTFPIDGSLAEALLAEGPRILGWIVKGASAWQDRGLDPPLTVTSATSKYQADSDPLRMFLETACTLGATKSVRAGILFNHYTSWAEREGIPANERLTGTAFGSKMAERFADGRDNRGRYYIGIGIYPTLDNDVE